VEVYTGKNLYSPELEANTEDRQRYNKTQKIEHTDETVKRMQQTFN